MGGMCNKTRKVSRVAADLPKARAFCYVLFEVTNKISQTTHCNAKLQKNQANSAMSSRAALFHSLLGT